MGPNSLAKSEKWTHIGHTDPDPFQMLREMQGMEKRDEPFWDGTKDATSWMVYRAHSMSHSLRIARASLLTRALHCSWLPLKIGDPGSVHVLAGGPSNLGVQT